MSIRSRRPVLALATLVLLAAPNFGFAQSEGFSDQASRQLLDEAARERSGLPGDPATPAPAPRDAGGATSLPSPVPGGYECLSAAYGSPVLDAARPDARQIGFTQFEVAASGVAVNGFVRVLHYNGHRGWVRATDLRPFRPVFPDQVIFGTCAVSVRVNGEPEFAYR